MQKKSPMTPATKTKALWNTDCKYSWGVQQNQGSVPVQFFEMLYFCTPKPGVYGTAFCCYNVLICLLANWDIDHGPLDRIPQPISMLMGPNKEV